MGNTKDEKIMGKRGREDSEEESIREEKTFWEGEEGDVHEVGRRMARWWSSLSPEKVGCVADGDRRPRPPLKVTQKSDLIPPFLQLFDMYIFNTMVCDA